MSSTDEVYSIFFFVQKRALWKKAFRCLRHIIHSEYTFECHISELACKSERFFIRQCQMDNFVCFSIYLFVLRYLIYRTEIKQKFINLKKRKRPRRLMLTPSLRPTQLQSSSSFSSPTEHRSQTVRASEKADSDSACNHTQSAADPSQHSTLAGPTSSCAGLCRGPRPPQQIPSRPLSSLPSTSSQLSRTNIHTHTDQLPT